MICDIVLALHTDSYLFLENENDDSTLLFSGFISFIVEFKNIASFQKGLMLISSKLSLLWLQCADLLQCIIDELWIQN